MIAFNSVLRSSDGVEKPPPRGLSVIRVKPSVQYNLISAEENGLLIGVHYYRKRSIPCAGVGCPACECVAKREYAYLGCLAGTTDAGRSRVVVELPARTMYEIRECGSVLRGSVIDSLVGVAFTAFRRKGPKSPVVVADVEQTSSAVVIPKKEVTDALCRMWQIPFAPDDLDNKFLMDHWLAEVLRRVKSDHHYR